MKVKSYPAPPLPERRWLTVHEAARYLACSERMIRSWERAGLIRAARPSPQIVRFDRRSLDAHLEQSCA